MTDGRADDRAISRPVPHGSVFVDDSGRRGVFVRTAMRLLVGLVALAIGIVVVSVLGGVPLPGITPRVVLPVAEPARPAGSGIALPARADAPGGVLPASPFPASPVPVAGLVTGRASGAPTPAQGSASGRPDPAATPPPSAGATTSPGAPGSTPAPVAPPTAPTPMPSPTRSVPRATPNPHSSKAHASKSRTVAPGKAANSHGRLTPSPS